MTELNPEMIVKAMQDISDPDMQAAKEMQEEDKAAGVDRPIEYYKMMVSQEKVATEAEFGGAEEDPEGFIDSIKSYFSDEDKKSEDPESYDEDKAIEKILAENYEDFYQTSNDEGGFYDSGTPEDTARKQASQLYEGLHNGQAGYLQGASQQFNNADPGLANQQINQGELAMQQGPGVTGAQVVQPPTQQGISATSGLSQQQIMEALQRFQQPEQPNPMAQDQQLRQMALQGIQGNGIQGGGITPEMLSRFQSNIGITRPGTFQ